MVAEACREMLPQAHAFVRMVGPRQLAQLEKLPNFLGLGSAMKLG